MARKSKEKPSFFKVLSNMDFTKILRLPPSFLKRYDLNLSENVKIRAAYSGKRIWNVKVERKKNSVFCFTDGWQKFVEGMGLKLGEFLVFYLVGKSEFDVIIYETSCCERDIPNAQGSYVKQEMACSSDVVGPSRRRRRRESCSEKSNPLYFEKCLRFHQRSRMAGGMIGRKHVRMKYVGNPNSQKYVVVVDDLPQRNRFDLTKGWPRFREENKLVYGKIYSFEFDPNKNVIHVNQVD